MVSLTHRRKPVTLKQKWPYPTIEEHRTFFLSFPLKISCSGLSKMSSPGTVESPFSPLSDSVVYSPYTQDTLNKEEKEATREAEKRFHKEHGLTDLDET